MLRRLRIYHLLAALFFGSLGASSAAYGVTVRDLSGTWLIATESHYFLIESGVIVARYPVLVITDQGDFRAYLFGDNCRSALTGNPNIPETVGLAPCIMQLAESDADRLTGIAFPVAQGKVVVDDSGWRFLVKNRQAMTDVINSSRRINPLVDGVPYEYVIFTKLFNGALRVSVPEGRLEIAEPNGSFAYHFVRVRPEHLAGIGSLMEALGLSYGQYFRCALDNLKDATLLRAAEQMQELSNKQAALYFDLLHGRSELIDLQRLADKKGLLQADLMKTPAGQASAEGKLGAYLGCPNRDR